MATYATSVPSAATDGQVRPSGDGRMDLFDIAKGVAIVCVVIFHVTDGYVRAGYLGQTDRYQFLYNCAYDFHVQLFTIIAGYFAYPKRTQWRYQVNRVTSLYWSYLLWSLFIVLLSKSFSSAVNTQLATGGMQTILFVPVLHMWYLLTLIVCTLGLFVVRGKWYFAGAAVLCLSVGVFTRGPFDCFYWFPFMLLGATLRHFRKLPPRNVRYFIVSCTLAFLGAWLAIQLDMNIRDWRFYWSNVAACYAVYYVCALITSPRMVKVLVFCGKASMAIYILHVIAGAGMRAVLHHLPHWVPTSVNMIACIAGAICLPLGVLLAARRLKIDKIVGLSPFSIVRT